MQLITRSLSVLRAVSGTPDGMTLQELSRSLQIPAPTMHRLVGALAAERFLVRSDLTKRYLIGPDALRLANGMRPVAETSQDVLRDLVAGTSETAFLAEMIGDRAVCVGLVSSPRPLRLFVSIGQELPLHAAASARSIVAFLDEKRVNEMLGRAELAAFTSETPTTVDELLERLRIVRERGYDICDEELDPGVWATGAPVRDRSGGVVASVTVAGPIERVTATTRGNLVERVVEASAAISARLGYQPNA
jgi:IclR family acetate operon transcriptional repressor